MAVCVHHPARPHDPAPYFVSGCLVCMVRRLHYTTQTMHRETVEGDLTYLHTCSARLGPEEAMPEAVSADVQAARDKLKAPGRAALPWSLCACGRYLCRDSPTPVRSSRCCASCGAWFLCGEMPPLRSEKLTKRLVSASLLAVHRSGHQAIRPSVHPSISPPSSPCLSLSLSLR
jgi:hypothetical protein